MISVAIIIVHFNTDQETKECLRSLQEIATKNLNVSTFVIDNGSKTVLEVNEKDQPNNTRIIRSDSNLGFTDGNNLGISIATREVQPEYFVLLNNDTTVQPDFLEKLVAAAQANPRLGMAVPKIYFSEGREFHAKSYKSEQRGKVLWFAGGSIDWANLDAFHRGVDEVDRQHFDSQRDTEFATGCCVLLPRTIVERVGTFDPKYFLYLEDVDWSLRIVQAGYEIELVPEAVVWHKNAGSSGGSGSPLHQYYQTRNRLYFFTKYARMHFLSGVKRPKLKHYLALSWFYLRILNLAFKYLTSSQSIVRRATSDWLLNRMGKQAVF
jgi:GT2 family glycosyltransferase